MSNNKSSNLTKELTGFTQVSNNLIYDNRISLKAKSFYLYLLSNKDKKITYDNLRKDLSITTGVINSCYEELQKNGWITQKYEPPFGRIINMEVKNFKGRVQK